MAGKATAGLCLLLVLTSLPAAGVVFQEYEATFDIHPGGRVVETLRIGLANATSQDVSIPLAAGRATALAVRNSTTGLPVEEAPGGGLRVLLPRGSTEFFVSFVAEDLVYARGEETILTTVLRPPADLRVLRIQVLLPEGHVLSRETLSPPGPVPGSDGRRITLNWSLPGGDAVAVIVPYAPPRPSPVPWALAGLGVAASVAGVAAVHFRRRASEARFEGYTEDQQRAIGLLQDRRTMDQDELREALDFSKAKATRVVQALEKKGLLEKEKSGKTNRLRWKGG